MQKITEESIKGLKTVNSLKSPHAISTFCPLCYSKVTFQLQSEQVDSHRRTVSSTGICPDCRKPVYFWAFQPANQKLEVFMLPVCGENLETRFSDSNLPDELKRIYEATIDAYNTKNYRAAAVSCRVALEGIFKLKLSSANQNVSLNQAINMVSQSPILTQPFTDLSHAVRKGGNLGAHFDLAKEPDRDMTKGMIDLIEYLIEFLYLLPNQIDELENKVQ